MVVFSKKLQGLRQISWCEWELTQGPILLHPFDHKVQDRVCLLGLTPLIGHHAGNLWAILYWVQDMQVTTLYLNGSHGAIGGGLLHGRHHNCSDSVVGAQSVGHTGWARTP